MTPKNKKGIKFLLSIRYVLKYINRLLFFKALQFKATSYHLTAFMNGCSDYPFDNERKGVTAFRLKIKR